jgi:hypothetical protein
MKIRMPIWRILLLVSLVLVPPSSARNAEPSKAQNTGFEAVIEGAYSGNVAGAGVLKFLPQGGVHKQGYYFLADGQGVRAHGVTFVLPPGARVGKRELASPSPFEIGTVASVRVDRDMGNSVVSAQDNSTGCLDLTAFPDDARRSPGSQVAGRFEFETEDRNGRKIMVKGTFSFKVK